MNSIKLQFKQSPFLLSVLVFLFFLKVIFQPVLEWQNEQLRELALTESRIQKAEKVIAQNNAISDAVAYKQALLARYESYFFSAISRSKFKIDQQREITKLLHSFNLTVVNIGWQSEFRYVDTDVSREQIQLKLEGDVHAIAKFMLHIENHDQLISIGDIEMIFRELSQDIEGRAAVDLTLAFYIQDKNNEE